MFFWSASSQLGPLHPWRTKSIWQFPVEHMVSGPRICVLSQFSCVQLFATLWTVVFQAPLSMGFSTQEYWSGLPLPTPGDLPNLGIEPVSPALQADSLPTEPPGKPPQPPAHSLLFPSSQRPPVPSGSGFPTTDTPNEWG